MMIDVGMLTYDQMLELRLKLNEHITGVETQAKAELDAGRPFKGFVLKAGRKSRKVIDESKLVDALSQHIDYSDLYTAKLIGLPAIEKALKAKNLNKDQIAGVLSQHVSESVTAPSLMYVGEAN